MLEGLGREDDGDFGVYGGDLPPLFLSQCLKRLPSSPGDFLGFFLGFLYPYMLKNHYFLVFDMYMVL